MNTAKTKIESTRRFDLNNLVKSAMFGLLVVTMVLGTVGCSDQWREVDTGASEEDISAALDRMTGAQEATTVNGSLATQLLNDSKNVIYYKQSASPGAVPETVMSLIDVGPFFAGKSGMNIFDLQLTSVAVALIDGVVETSFGAQRYFLLLIEMSPADGSAPTYYAQTSAPGAYFFDEKNDTFEAEFAGKDGSTVILKTFDLDSKQSNELGAAVKFDVYTLNPDGTNRNIGQFGALAGFGG